MSSDKLDSKVRDAANQQTEPYSEEAWQKMEQLLDKHMPKGSPVSMPARRFSVLGLIFLFAVIAITSLSILFLYKPAKKDSSETGKISRQETIGTNQITEKPANATISTHEQDQSQSTETSKIRHKGVKVPEPVSSDVTATETNTAQKSSHLESSGTSLESSGKIKQQMLAGTQLRKQQQPVKTMNYDGLPTEKNKDRSTIVDNSADANVGHREPPGIIWKATPLTLDHQLNSSVTTLGDWQPPSPETGNFPKEKRNNNSAKSFGSRFNLSLSTGPDVNSIGMSRFGRLAMSYGVGAGFFLNEHWQIRTGYFITDKKYGAYPDDYNPPKEFWVYYPHLKDIHANCLISEVPLIVSYNFQPKNKLRWFISGGLSSVFMKRETYDYTSMGYSGNLYTKSYTINNQNQHYLSSLRVSGGFTKQLNRIISLTTEPYFSLPLSGVGYGKVKLGSSGMLISVNLKPFAKY